MNKVVILYDSQYGNTKKFAMSLSRGLEAGGLYVDCDSIQNFEIEDLKNYDVIGIGCSTRFHGISSNVKIFFNKIRNLNLESKQGFIFEIKTADQSTGSAAKWIEEHLKKMNVNIIYPIISDIAFDKKGFPCETSLDKMEEIGLDISDVINFNEKYQSKFRLFINRLKWVLLSGGPLFFFIRALTLALTGGDCFGTINPGASWFLLISEMSISGITGIAGIIGLKIYLREKRHVVNLSTHFLRKIVIFGGFSSYILHFVRVAIWIILCVI